MPGQAVAAPLVGSEGEWLDPRSSPALALELPALATALDPQAMRMPLEETLFGNCQGRYSVERCGPRQATYVPGLGCRLRYELEVADRDTGVTFEPLVNARVFSTPSAARGYLRERLMPLAERARVRPDLAPLGEGVAVVENLSTVVSVFPIDGELPALVDASDPRRIAGILSEALPAVAGRRPAIVDCRVSLGHYGRRHRCVLRYDVEAAGTNDGRERLVVYGKVAADDRGAVSHQAISALREGMAAGDPARRFRIPASLGFHPELGLSLLTSVPGQPQVGRLLEARVRGGEPAAWAALTLEASIESCARVAAALHTSKIVLGRRRGPADELRELQRGIRAMGRISPDLAARLGAALEHAEDRLRATRPLAPCLSHGDFSSGQLLFEGAECGLVDFDTICQAEPALDLAHFLAYLRLAVLRAQKAAVDTNAVASEQLCERFLAAYLDAADPELAEASLRERLGGYELVSLLRLALHSWQKLKIGRLADVMAVLEDRLR